MQKETLLDIAMMHADAMVERARNGDSKAQGKLVELWYKRIYNFAWKYFHDHDRATEVAQLTFIAMYRNVSQLSDASKFRPWLYRIASNTCHEEARKESRHQDLFQDMGAYHDAREVAATDAGQNPEHQYLQVELSEQVLKALGTLSHEQKTVVVMKEFEGLKFREIAEALQIPENTVKSRLYYGLTHLKKELELRNIDLKTL